MTFRTSNELFCSSCIVYNEIKDLASDGGLTFEYKLHDVRHLPNTVLVETHVRAAVVTRQATHLHPDDAHKQQVS